MDKASNSKPTYTATAADLEKDYEIQPGNLVEMDFTTKKGRLEKATDILIFDRMGNTAKTNNQGKPIRGALLRGASNKLFTMLFRTKANNQDVYNIFRTNGMNPAQADAALSNVKAKSEQLKLSGISAQAVQFEISQFKLDLNSW